MKAENWIERYVHEIGRHLPRRMRDDVQQELHSLLQEMFWERLEQTPETKEEQVALNLIREFGKPEEVALRYLPKQTLIGADSFPYYLVVLKVWLGIVTLLFAAATLYTLITRFPEAPLTYLGENFGEWFTSMLVNFGLITLIFAIAERVGAWRPQKDSSWDPRSLPEHSDPNQIKRGELVAGIVFLIIFIVILNFFPNWIGLIDVAGEQWGIVTLLSVEFYQHIPWMTASALLDMMVKVIVLGRGRWEVSTRLAELLASLFGIFVLYRILNGGEILVIPILTTLAKVGLRVTLIITLLDTIIKLYRLITHRPRPFWPLKTAQQ